MSGIIKTIKAKDDNNIQHNIFPKTVLEAVVDSETNETLDAILGDKLTKTDIVDNCLSNRADLPLSANQGAVLTEKIDRITGYNTLNYADCNGVAIPAYFKDKCPLLFIGITYGTVFSDSIILPSYSVISGRTSILTKLTDRFTGTSVDIEVNWGNNTILANWGNEHSEKVNVYVHICGIHSNI